METGKYEPLTIYGRISVRREFNHTPERLMYCTSNASNVKQSRPCEWCSKSFDIHPQHQNRKYCSVACKRAAELARTAPCVFVCKYCGNEFKPKKKDRNQFCCREHAYLFRKANAKTRPPKLERLCACGKRIDSKQAARCDDCTKQLNRAKATEYARVKFEATVLPRRCKHCGEIFTPKYGKKRRTYCSDACLHSASKRASKAHKSGNARGRIVLRDYYGETWRSHYEPINSLAVFNRDGWVCLRCGCKVYCSKKFELLQATVDHVVPLSRGGDHTYANVQTLCMGCNIEKADKE